MQQRWRFDVSINSIWANDANGVHSEGPRGDEVLPGVVANVHGVRRRDTEAIEGMSVGALVGLPMVSPPLIGKDDRFKEVGDVERVELPFLNRQMAIGDKT